MPSVRTTIVFSVPFRPDTFQQDAGGFVVADIRVERSELYGIDVPESLVAPAIDEFPVLFVAAAAARGRTRVTGAEELRVKETDRIAVMREELSKCGANIEERPDGLIIRHSPLKGGTVWSHRDHRIAMAMAVGALGAERPIAIRDAEAVAVTVPQFFPLLRSLYI